MFVLLANKSIYCLCCFPNTESREFTQESLEGMFVYRHLFYYSYFHTMFPLSNIHLAVSSGHRCKLTTSAWDALYREKALGGDGAPSQVSRLGLVSTATASTRQRRMSVVVWVKARGGTAEVRKGTLMSYFFS